MKYISVGSYYQVLQDILLAKINQMISWGDIDKTRFLELNF